MPPPNPGKVRVDWGDWTIVGNDLVRQYDFQGLPFAAKLMLQIRITVEMGSFGIPYSLIKTTAALKAARYGALRGRGESLCSQSMTRVRVG